MVYLNSEEELSASDVLKIPSGYLSGGYRLYMKDGIFVTVDDGGLTPTNMSGDVMYAATSLSLPMSSIPSTVISVNISWGTMEFTYTDGEWQPESHTHTDGEWTPDATDGNLITVKNNSNIAVNVTFAYTKIVTEVEGSFTDGNGNGITSGLTVAVGAEKKIMLVLNGTPSNTFESTTLGSVTVTITQDQNP